MKLEPDVDTDVEWDDSTPLRLIDWKDVVPRGRAPVSYASSEVCSSQAWQQGEFLEDLCPAEPCSTGRRGRKIRVMSIFKAHAHTVFGLSASGQAAGSPIRRMSTAPESKSIRPAPNCVRTVRRAPDSR